MSKNINQQESATTTVAETESNLNKNDGAEFQLTVETELINLDALYRDHTHPSWERIHKAHSYWIKEEKARQARRGKAFEVMEQKYRKMMEQSARHLNSRN